MKRSLLAIVAAASIATMFGLRPAEAHDHWHHGGYGYGGPRVSLSFDVWRGGYWHRGWYGPRYGWWWVVPSAGYYYYNAPIYPYPDYYRPSTAIIEHDSDAMYAPPQGVPQQQYWYYCRDPDGYYPYVAECRGEWRQVPVTPPTAPPASKQ
jgi:hypothetical protein